MGDLDICRLAKALAIGMHTVHIYTHIYTVQQASWADVHAYMYRARRARIYVRYVRKDYMYRTSMNENGAF